MRLRAVAPAILSLVFWCWSGQAAPRFRSVRPRPDLSRILWIGAHPDDETLIAPLLGRECVDGPADCTLLVMTVGEKGGSGTVRAQEMQSAAALLHARLIQWTEPDLMESVADVWPRNTLVNDIEAVIAEVRPTTIITFDPTHGSSCHPAHRFTASMVVDAAGSTPVYFVETFYTVDNSTFVFRDAVASSRMLVTYNAAATWHFLVADVRTHASQFTSAQADALAAQPMDQKNVYLMPATAASDAQYNAHCP
jgi:LmbE family N-acetylglucosaminyl deacetylase